MVTWLIFATVTVGLPYLVARMRPGSLWGAVAPAYSAGTHWRRRIADRKNLAARG